MQRRFPILVFSIALLIIILLFSTNAYYLQSLYKEKIARSEKVYNHFQNLSRLINNAAFIQSDLVKSGTKNIFFADSQSVIHQITTLQSTAHDSINIRIAEELNPLLKAEISWLLKSNVPDSIVHHKALNHLAALSKIYSLINDGLARTDRVIQYNNSLLKKANANLNIWLLLFFADFALMSSLMIYNYVDHKFRKKREANDRIHFLASIADNIQDPAISSTISVRNDFKITQWNKPAEQLFEWKIDEVVGKNPEDVFKINYPNTSKAQILEQCNKNGFWQGELIYHTKTGKTVPVLVTLFYFKDLRGKVISNLTLVKDITDRKRTDEELKQLNAELEQRVDDRTEILVAREIRFRSLMEHSAEGITLTDEFGKMIYRSPGSKKITGDLSIKKIISRIHPDDKKKLKGFYGEVLQKPGISASFIGRFMHEPGSYIWLEGTFTNLLHLPGVNAIVANYRDISKRKELENLLHKANVLARIGSWEINMLTGTVFWDDITREIHEAENDFVPNLSNGLNFYKEGPERDLMTKKVTEAIELCQPWDEELQIVTAKKNERWIRTIGQTEFVNGQCVKINGSFQDIDDRKFTELKLRNTVKSLDDYRYVINESSIFSITDPRGIITYINNNFCAISKYERAEILGQTHRLTNSDHHPKSFFKDLWNTISSGKIWHGEIKNKTKFGDYYWVDTTIVPILDHDNKPLQYMSTRVDITKKKEAEESALKSFNERNTILESIGDAFFAVDNNWLVTYWNSKAEQILKMPKNKIIGYNLWHLFSDRTETISYTKYHEALKLRQIMHFEDFYPDISKWYEISAYPSENGLSVYFKDATERKNAEAEILKLNRLYMFTAEINKMILKVTEEATLFSEACRISIDIGKFKMSWIGMIDEITQEIVPVSYEGEEKGYLSMIKSISAKNTSTGRGPTGTAAREGKDIYCNDIENDPQMAPWRDAALERGYHSSMSLPIKKFGKIMGTYNIYAATKNFFNNEETALLQDATANVGFALENIEKALLRKKAEQNLVLSNEDLRNLSTHLQTIREEERMHIAREIHDELGQQLTGLKMDVSWLNSKLLNKNQEIERIISEINELISETVDSVRRISANLRPAILDDLGLISALEWQSRETQKRSDITINFTCNIEDIELPFNINTGLFRIYQEALTNAVRHSNADTINSSAHIADNLITLRISDNGKGIEQKPGSNKSFGLLGIKERAFLMNGTIEITSNEGKGTSIFVSVPYDLKNELL